MLSEDEFVERWRRYVGGTIALGHASLRIYMIGDAKGKHPAEAVLEKLDSEAIDLLKKLYRDMVKSMQPASKPEASNGRTHQGNGPPRQPAKEVQGGSQAAKEAEIPELPNLR